jgi:hypothetical protein
MKRTAQKTLAGIVAVFAAMYGAMVLWGIGYIAWSIFDAGSGGIGAVSFGLVDLGLGVPLAGAVANRVLVHWSRRAGGKVLALHRTHSILLLLVVGLVVLSVIVLNQPGVVNDARVWMVIFFVAEAALAVQALLLALILAFFVIRKL